MPANLLDIGDQNNICEIFRPELVIRFRILPKDATIISEAERMVMYSLATLDSD